MARVCREIQERIEETREEAREECRNVSRTITETICSWMPWPLSELCDLVTRVITEVVCGIVWVVVTVVSWVTRIVCEIIYVIDWIITHLVGIIEWLGNRIITFPEWLICQMGLKAGRKRLRICPVVIADERGVPSVPIATIQEHINFAINLYRDCDVDIIASDIITVNEKSHLTTVSGCDTGGFFAEDRAELERLRCCNGLIDSIKCLRFPSGLIWPRPVLKAIWVDVIRNATPGTDTRGCYMLPDSFVLIDSTALQDTLAHELGHACDLLHRNSEPTNLMAPGSIRTGSNLTGSQCCTIRTGRFVTIL